MRTYITSEGDTTDRIAWRVYGTQGARVTEKLLDANPGLADHGPVLPAGITISLPELATAAEKSAAKLWG